MHRGDIATEGVPHTALELYPKARRTQGSVLSKETTQSNLCFRMPTLLLWGEWTELSLTLPSQQQFKTLGSSRAPVAAIATRKSAAHLRQIPDAVTPKSMQAQKLYGEQWMLHQCWTFRKLTPDTEKKVAPSFSPPAWRPTLRFFPPPCAAGLLYQFT